MEGRTAMRKNRISWLATALALSCALLMGALAQASGYYYEATTANVAEKKKHSDDMKVLAWVDGDKAKIQFVSQEKKGVFADGSYLVTKDGGENVYLVDPRERTYARFDMEEMMAAVGQVMNTMEQLGGMMKMEFSDIYSEKLLEEPGGTILGRSTTRYRYKSGYTMNMKVMGFNQQTTTDSIQDLWITTDLDSRGFGVWLRPDRNMKTGNDELDKLISQEMGKINGFPLKTVNVSTMTNKKGKSQQLTSITEVKVLREESIAGDIFGWPSDYTETQFMPGMPEGYGDQQAAKDSKKKKKKGVLSGLFDKSDDDG